MTSSASCFPLACFRLAILLSACVLPIAAAEAQPMEQFSRRSTAGIPGPVDPGGSLFHGNYCGPGSRPGHRPIDALDAACMRHDACARGAVTNCACNTRFQREAEAIARNPRQSPDMQFLASAAAVGATFMMCQPADDAGDYGRPYRAHQPRQPMQ